MANSDKILKKALNDLDKKLKDAGKEESVGNIEKAIKIREEVLRQFIGMGMNERASEQYERIYALAKEYGDTLRKEGNRAAGLWYKKAEEMLDKLPPDDARKKEIDKLRADTGRNVVELYKEEKKGMLIGNIVAGMMKGAAEEAFTEEDKAKEEKEEFGRKMDLDKGILGKFRIREIHSYLAKENALHEAISRGRNDLDEEAAKDVEKHIGAGKRNSILMNHYEAACEFLTAAKICSSIKDDRATMLFTRAGDEYMKAGGKLLGESEKDRISDYSNAVLAYIYAEDRNKASFATKKLEEIYAKKIKEYIKDGLNVPAKDEIDEAVNVFANLGMDEIVNKFTMMRTKLK
jgi:hypothetical protein